MEQGVDHAFFPFLIAAFLSSVGAGAAAGCGFPCFYSGGRDGFSLKRRGSFRARTAFQGAEGVHDAALRTGDRQGFDLRVDERGDGHAAFDSGVNRADLPFKADAHQPRTDFAVANAGHACAFAGGIHGLNGGN
jgi:hypothetical protein